MSAEHVGDQVRVFTEQGEFEGVLMPSYKDSLVVIKLDSGYNRAFLKKNVKKITVHEVYKQHAEKVVEEKQRSGLPTIAVLHTGGTIASKVDYRTGGVVARFSPTELIEMFPELKDMVNVRSRLISNMWSEDMRFDHYNGIAKAIEDEVKLGCRGVIITHGTDTLHYTAAALSFIFESLPVPIILVGAQRSSDRGSSDAGMNLLCAARFIIETDFAGVALCMHESSEDVNCVILPGTNARKLHTSRRDAFKVVNGLPWALVSYADKTVSWLRKDWPHQEKGKEVRMLLFDKNCKVGLLKAHPHMYTQEFEVYKGFDGLVIEGFGVGGHLPINVIDPYTKEHGQISNMIAELVKKDVVVALSSQTVYGRINMNVYSTGRDLMAMGIIGDYCDMTAETAFVKLAWLLSNYSKSEVKKLFGKNLRGEISKRTMVDDGVEW